MSWTEEDLQIIRDVPLAVRLSDGSANRFVVGRDKPEDLIEPDKPFEGSFTDIALILTAGNAVIDTIRYPFEATNPTQAEVAAVIYIRNSRSTRFHRTEIDCQKSLGSLLGFVCRPLP